MFDFLSLKLHKDLLLRYIIKMEHMVGKKVVIDHREMDKKTQYKHVVIYKIFTEEFPAVRVNMMVNQESNNRNLQAKLKHEIEIHNHNIKSNLPSDLYQYPCTDMQRVLSYNNLQIESIEELKNVTRNEVLKRIRNWNYKLNPLYNENRLKKQREYYHENKDKSQIKKELSKMGINDASKAIFKRAYTLIQKQKLELQQLEEEYEKYLMS